MKTLQQHITERLVLPKNKKGPKSKEELKEMIEAEINKNGNNCSLNHIDVSNITDMDELFSDFPEFNGDISKWDVSNVEYMHAMFWTSKFTGDISDWDVSNVKTMTGMFSYSPFNGDISNWDVSKVKNKKDMFFYCPLKNNPPKWYNK